MDHALCPAFTIYERHPMIDGSHVSDNSDDLLRIVRKLDFGTIEDASHVQFISSLA
jgi:hypothetical protein